MSARRLRLRWLGTFPETGVTLWWAPRPTATRADAPAVRLRGGGLVWVDSRKGLAPLHPTEARGVAARYLRRGVDAVIDRRGVRVLERLARGEGSSR